MFDPYHRWLAIPPDQRPPTFYQLLGISVTETDTEVIKEAALRQASHVRTHQMGPHAQMCTSILNEIGQACATLVHPGKRRDYDDRSAKPVPLPSNPVSAPPPILGVEPPPLPVVGSSENAMENAFGAIAEDAKPTRRLDPHSRSRRSRAGFWKEPAAYLYVCLLCAGVGLGMWAARGAIPRRDVDPQPHELAPSGSPRKTLSQP